MDVELPKPHGKMAETIEEAARDVAKCLNERNGNGLDLRHVAMLVYHAQHTRPELTEYDAGLLNDYGGGNVDWWQDYIRAELGRAYEYYQSQL